ncbi:ethanolamine ammonia-lyase reactivating factor EutA [Caloramator mitchellensis]|uniref:ethanolamine ammonia-lyase reactivating factor EutA n=1 Tax=Caloramator mitchellensis TaxID=908809 RepID=UPI0007173703|nr:ethanolamine ammonia-lyase reactivating factor EutA [Caloramator mitchellensis]
MKEEIISVGIDIGTSTTQLIFSKLIIENTASAFTIPKIKIVDKQVFFKSEIYFTPLISSTEIDMEKVKKIIEIEYSKAGIKPEDVKTGAVIITGETARKKNANNVLNSLSKFAGEFVVATAGPELEAIIAGRGAGAENISKENDYCVANIDIGGGTTNIAVFDSGEVVDTCALDVGGRLIKFDENNRKINYASNKIIELAKELGIDLKLDDEITLGKIKIICSRMAEILEEVFGLRARSKLLEKMLITKPLNLNYKIDSITFSGGVADFIYNQSDNYLAFNDIGIVLGEAISKSSLFKKLKVFKPQETIRATVIGSGMHTVELSGSTIMYSKDIFPIKNIPVIRLNNESDYKLFSSEIEQKINWFIANEELQNIAIAFKGTKNPSFNNVSSLAEKIITGLNKLVENRLPIIVIVENDFAKALGHSIVNKLNKKNDVVCIDGIRVENGDFVDIGKPISNGRVVPIVIKTLLFK